MDRPSYWHRPTGVRKPEPLWHDDGSCRSNGARDGTSCTGPRRMTTPVGTTLSTKGSPPNDSELSCGRRPQPRAPPSCLGYPTVEPGDDAAAAVSFSDLLAGAHSRTSSPAPASRRTLRNREYLRRRGSFPVWSLERDGDSQTRLEQCQLLPSCFLLLLRSGNLFFDKEVQCATSELPEFKLIPVAIL